MWRESLFPPLRWGLLSGLEVNHWGLGQVLSSLENSLHMTHFRYPQILRGDNKIITFTMLRKTYYQHTLVFHVMDFHSSHLIWFKCYWILTGAWSTWNHIFPTDPAHMEQNTDEHTHLQMLLSGTFCAPLGCGQSLTLILIMTEWLFRAFSSSVMLQALVFPHALTKTWLMESWGVARAFW